MGDPAEDRPARLLLVGYGRMGRLVAELSQEYGCEIAGRLDAASNRQGAGLASVPPVDVVVDFSTADAFVDNYPRLLRLGVPLVIGTTGWQDREPEVRRLAAEAGVGVVASSNFSLGVTLFEALAVRAATLFAPHAEYGAWIHEAHHAAKRDAPSGTALMVRAAMTRAGYDRSIDMSSTRAGSIPGTHCLGFDAASDTVTLTHAARDRRGFARGALVAARWVRGRRGWFSMRDVLGLA